MNIAFAILALVPLTLSLPAETTGCPTETTQVALAADEGGVANPLEEDTIVEVIVNGRVVSTGFAGPCEYFPIPRDPSTVGLPFQARFTPVAGGDTVVVNGTI